MQKVINCEICGRQSQFWTAINNYDHYRCNHCGHLFVFPRPTQDELDNFYKGGQYYDKAETEQVRLLCEASQRLRRLNSMSKRFGLEKRLLDVGCASGYFIKQAFDEGWRVTGIDRSSELVNRAREYSGTEVLNGILEEIELKNELYPIVTAWEVIEHTIDPRLFFSAISRNVAKGGLICLSTPLSNGMPARVLGSKFPMLTPPEHLSLFTRRSINHLASEFGFEEVSYRSFSNLNSTSLASGFAKLFARKNISETSKISRFLCKSAGFTLAWLPVVVDLLGWGTEMEIVLRRKII